VLARRSQRTCGDTFSPGREVYRAFVVIYFLALVVLVTQSIRTAVYSKARFSYSLLQQSLGAVAALLRMLVSLIFGDVITGLPLIAEALISSLPYMITFWVFTLLLFQWFSTLYLGMCAVTLTCTFQLAVFTNVSLCCVVFLYSHEARW
jgi:hypothetical protein